MGIEFGRVLRVNLETGSITKSMLDSTVAERYLGGRGLGAWMLYHELEGGVDPLSPANKLIFMTGPLVGTGVPSANRFVVMTKSPQTGLYLMTIAGGNFGTNLRRSGFDIIVVEGASEQPVYLKLHEGEATLCPADHLWGLGTFACEEHFEPAGGRTGVVCIGPGGENQVPYAGVFSDGRAAGRGGAGAVMGSKKLKAIVATGNVPIPIHDKATFRIALREAYAELAANPRTAESLPKLGSGGMVNVSNLLGVMPHKNFQEAALPEAEQIAGETLRAEHLVEDRACGLPCIVKCAKIYKATGEYEGWHSDGPEYETIYSLGSACSIYDANYVIAADRLCDDMGVDGISAGVSIAFAMECFERGLITTADTDGIPLKFGDHRAAFAMMKKIGTKEGFGAFLALGSKRMAEQIGQGSEAFAMHAKGMEMGAYDPRAIAAQAIVYAAGPRGGCHHSGGFPFYAEIASKDMFGRVGKAKTVKMTRDKRIALSDSTMLCTFTSVGLTDATIAKMTSAVVGRDLDPEWFYALGDRVSTIERAFNVREGLRPEHDTLPERLLSQPVPTGPSAGRTIDLAPLLADMYELCGWDPETGKPSAVRLAEAGI